MSKPFSSPTTLLSLAALIALPSGTATARPSSRSIERQTLRDYRQRTVQRVRSWLALDGDNNPFNGIQIDPYRFFWSYGYGWFAPEEESESLSSNALAYAWIRYTRSPNRLKLVAGNHHTLGKNSRGRTFSFGEDYGGVSYGDEENGRYCGAQMRTKLGRPWSSSIAPGEKVLTAQDFEDKSSFKALSEAEKQCFVDLRNTINQTKYNPKPRWIDDLRFARARSISTDQTDGVVVTRNGELYTFGPNNRGQAGVGDEQPVQEPTLVQLPGGEPVIYATSGAASTYAITVTGKVYSAGDNGNLQLGTNDNKDADSSVFQQITALDNVFIIDVAIRDTTVFALSREGDVYAWGNNSGAGELGNGTESVDSHVPTLILEGKDIIDVEAGADFGLAVDAEGTVYGWGNNRYGTLAMGTPERSGSRYRVKDIEEQLTPVVIEALSRDALNGDRIVEFQGGSRNAQALSATGDVYSWGDMTLGYFGNGYQTDENGIERQISVQAVKVEALDRPKVVSLSANTSSHFAVTMHRRVFVWGSTVNGRLGMPEGHCSYNNPEGANPKVCYTPVRWRVTP